MRELALCFLLAYPVPKEPEKPQEIVPGTIVLNEMTNICSRYDRPVNADYVLVTEVGRPGCIGPAIQCTISCFGMEKRFRDKDVITLYVPGK